MLINIFYGFLVPKYVKVSTVMPRLNTTLRPRSFSGRNISLDSAITLSLSFFLLQSNYTHKKDLSLIFEIQYMAHLKKPKKSQLLFYKNLSYKLTLRFFRTLRICIRFYFINYPVPGGSQGNTNGT